MRVVKFNFNKISIERLKDSYQGVKINSKINLSDLKRLGKESEKDSLIQVDFTYALLYAPEVANIEIGGRIILITEKAKAKDIEEKWKTKKMTEEFRIFLFNIILKKANLKALELEEQVNLPLHIPLPTLKKPKKE